MSSCFNVENIRIKYISLAKNLIGHPSGKEKNPGREELRRHPGSTQIPSLFLASERERGREGGGCRFDRGIKNRGDRVDPEFRAIRFRLWPSGGGGGGGVSTLPLVIFFSPFFFFVNAATTQLIGSPIISLEKEEGLKKESVARELRSGRLKD